MDLLFWLTTPISGTQLHTIEPWTYWHARLMVLAWAFAVPLGIVAARFFKIWPGQDWPTRRDHQGWWHLHRGFQYTGALAMLVGLALAWNQGSGTSAAALWHTRLGWCVVVLAGVQIALAWARGSKGGPTDQQMAGDHYDMTTWRLVFEYAHKFGGYLAVALAAVAIVTGMGMADAPRWMWLSIGLWWCLLIFAFVRLQRQGRCIDTYQAIWGPETGTPGSRRTPIGWGIRRYSAPQWRDRHGPFQGPTDPTKQ